MDETARQAAATLKAMNNNSSLKAAAAAVEAMNNNSGLKATAAAIEAMSNNSGLKAAAAAVEAMNNNSGLKAAAAAIEAMNKSSGLRAAAAAIEAMNKSSGLRAAAAALKAWGDQESPLLAYLATNVSPDISGLVEAAGAAQTRALAFGEAAVIRVMPALEGEIVELLRNGNAVEQLPKPAIAHLLEYVWYLYHAAQFFVLVVAMWQAVDFLKEKLSIVHKPTEIHQVLEQLPQEKLDLLTGYRVLIRNKVVLRSFATTQSEVLARPQIGTLVEVLEEGEAWIKVSVEIFGETMEGWIYRSYTAPIKIPHKQS